MSLNTGTRKSRANQEPEPDWPAVLQSGDHARIARWRRQQSLARTRRKRPDLFARLLLSPLDRELLAELDAESDA